MRYLIYTETFPSLAANDARQTGIGRYCADIGLGLQGLGHQVVVLTNDQIGGNAGSSNSLPLEVLGRPPRSGLDLRRRRAQVLRRMRQFQPDYLLVGDPLGHHVLAAGLQPSGSAVCPIFHGTELSAWRTARHSAPRSFRRMIRSWALRQYLRRARALISNSRFTAGLLRDLLPEASNECVVYPCVSDLVLSQPTDTSFRDTVRTRVSRGDRVPLILLTVARISERKNQLRVVQALDYLRSRTPESFHYILVGNVDAGMHQTYFRELQAYVTSSGLQDSVTIVDHASDQDKICYIDACDVLVMLSRTVGDSVEGFGISVIEASCRGKPVIVSDQGGMPETVIDGRTGRIVPDEVPALAQVLLDLARNAALRAQWGEAGRRFASENFTPASSAARLHKYLLGTS
jgi:glycosyltransferase involved in cell wall biosynthesis